MRNRGAKNQSHCADDRYYNLQTKMELRNCTKRSENKTQNNICIPLLFFNILREFSVLHSQILLPEQEIELFYDRY